VNNFDELPVNIPTVTLARLLLINPFAIWHRTEVWLFHEERWQEVEPTVAEGLKEADPKTENPMVKLFEPADTPLGIRKPLTRISCMEKAADMLPTFLTIVPTTCLLFKEPDIVGTLHTIVETAIQSVLSQLLFPSRARSELLPAKPAPHRVNKEDPVAAILFPWSCVR
jgi:hypothetical protein